MPIIDEAFLAGLVREPLAPEIPESQDEAFKKITRLVNARERCVSELRARLLRDGFEQSDIQAALQRAVACGMVDDLRYADILVRSRIAQGKGRAGIESELAASDILVADLPGWPDAYFPEDSASEEDRAFDLLCRKPPRSKNIYAAACRKLAACGFAADVVYAAARRYTRQHQCDERFF